MRTANCHDTAGLERFKRKASPTLLVLAVAAALGGLLTGCLPTAVHPVYQAGDLVLDPNLPGIWKSADGRNSWTFSAGEGKSYKLQVQAEEQRIECVAHLFKLGSELFLDLYPTTQALEKNLENNPYSLALIPAHVFFRVRATAPKLRLSCLGLDWLKEYLKRNPNAAAYVVLPDGRVALTGGTEALQAFIKLHLDDTSAWNDMYEDGLVRVPGKPGEKTSR